jgi:UDP-GlcNAc:undecaprenyl-phosphate/decaprenyl-phosphate GlcNAc-1-phosphate transferase
VISVVLAFIVVLVIVPATIPIALRFGFVSRPTADRWGSRTVTTLGGVGIAIGLAIGVGIAPLEPVDRIAMVIGILVLLIVGLLDDRAPISPRTRLTIQASIGVAFALVTFAAHPAWPGVAVLAAVAIPLAVNATNMVDNADGLAASLSLATALALAGFGMALTADGAIAIPALVVAGSCLGFLVYNLPPARVFMGDAGSLPLGFALAAVSILVARDATGPLAAVSTILVLLVSAWAIQLADVAMVFATRLARGASPFRGGVDHTSHRLMRAGMSRGGAVAALAVASAICGGIGVIASRSGDPFVVFAALVPVLLIVIAAEVAVARRTSPGQVERASARASRTGRSRTLIQGTDGKR